MAWYSDPASSLTYRRRKAFSLVTTATSSSIDVVLTIPSGWDEFWGAIDSNGYGVRFTAADGVTEIDYQQQSGTWDYASRVGVFELDDVALPSTADRCVLMWMYYSPSGGSATDGSTAFTPGTTATAAMEIGQPDPASAIPIRPQVPSEAAPASRIAKSTGETRDVFFDLTDILQPAAGRYNGQRHWEEPGLAAVDVLDSGGTSVPSMNEATAMRFVSVDEGGGGGRQRLYLRARVKAGTDSTKYTLTVDVSTTTPLSSPTYRTLPARLGVQVKNQLET